MAINGSGVTGYSFRHSSHSLLNASSSANLISTQQTNSVICCRHVFIIIIILPSSPVVSASASACYCIPQCLRLIARGRLVKRRI